MASQTIHNLVDSTSRNSTNTTLVALNCCFFHGFSFFTRQYTNRLTSLRQPLNSTRVSADWCHAWSLLGQWSSWVTFPVPASGLWPRHGHLRGILEGYKGQQPNFHKWARPAYEQGALPTLSILPGDVTIKVLPGDKMYQAMEVEPDFMRPVILHGFGASAKKRLPSRLAYCITKVISLNYCRSMIPMLPHVTTRYDTS